MYTDREAMKRQSTVLLATASSDSRLTQALMQIEQLSNELETLKQDHKEKVQTYFYHLLMHAHSLIIVIIIERFNVA